MRRAPTVTQARRLAHKKRRKTKKKKENPPLPSLQQEERKKKLEKRKGLDLEEHPYDTTTREGVFERNMNSQHGMNTNERTRNEKRKGNGIGRIASEASPPRWKLYCGGEKRVLKRGTQGEEKEEASN